MTTQFLPSKTGLSTGGLFPAVAGPFAMCMLSTATPITIPTISTLITSHLTYYFLAHKVIYNAKKSQKKSQESPIVDETFSYPQDFRRIPHLGNRFIICPSEFNSKRRYYANW